VISCDDSKANKVDLHHKEPAEDDAILFRNGQPEAFSRLKNYPVAEIQDTRI
jgi:hypothetical protein